MEIPSTPPLLRQVVQSCAEVEDFIDGMSRDDFMADLKTQRAIMMTFVIIAEIIDRIRLEDPQLLEQLTAVPWTEIRGMRNRLVHGDLTIDLGTVWATASISIPQLRRTLEQPHSGS
jgi:uncharacterized protein with HEPN domain